MAEETKEKDQKPLACPECGQTFADKRGLRGHYLGKHGEGSQIFKKRTEGKVPFCATCKANEARALAAEKALVDAQEKHEREKLELSKLTSLVSPSEAAQHYDSCPDCKPEWDEMIKARTPKLPAPKEIRIFKVRHAT